MVSFKNGVERPGYERKWGCRLKGVAVVESRKKENVLFYLSGLLKISIGIGWKKLKSGEKTCIR